MTGRILVSRDGDIATVTLANPDKLNAVNYAMWCDLAEAMARLSADESLRCVVLRGEGEAFAAGGDIEEFAELAVCGDEASLGVPECKGLADAFDRIAQPLIRF